MKTVTIREFYHSLALNTLRSGQSLIVTDKIKTKFIVTKPGKPQRKTRADLEREALEICPKATPRVNFTEALREMKIRLS
jgi:hypothetical protein